MTRIRELIGRYPAASAVIAAAVLAVAGWRIYQTTAGASLAGRSALLRSASPAPSPAPFSTPAVPTPAPGDRQDGSASGGAAGAPASGRNTGASGPTESGGGGPIPGRDPFASPIGSGTGGSQPLPPVPPLVPGNAAGPGAGGPGASGYRVAGIVGDSVALALAIVEDGTRSYIVEPGDELRPGVRVTAIDAMRGVVQLTADGLPLELQLTGRGKAP